MTKMMRTSKKKIVSIRDIKTSTKTKVDDIFSNKQITLLEQNRIHKPQAKLQFNF